MPPQDGVELQVGKTVGMVTQGSCRSLIIYRCALEDQGVYVCDAQDAQTSASLKVQGESWVEWRVRAGCKDALSPASPSEMLGPLAMPLNKLGLGKEQAVL